MAPLYLRLISPGKSKKKIKKRLRPTTVSQGMSKSSSSSTLSIEVCGARQNNLQGIDIEIPIGELTVVTGPSGSGKSSLAFQTLYAEGQRRYVESLSTYARQFLSMMEKPDIGAVAPLRSAAAGAAAAAAARCQPIRYRAKCLPDCRRD